jgi:hypothetical protein
MTTNDSNANSFMSSLFTGDLNGFTVAGAAVLFGSAYLYYQQYQLENKRKERLAARNDIIDFNNQSVLCDKDVN